MLFHDVALPRAGGPYADRPYGHYFLAPHYIINDLTAAVLLVQLGKVDGYIASKIQAAERIIEGLADIDELIPQAVRPGDRHTYWILGFSLDTERLGCSADVFADAVRHEGVLLIKAENSVDARHPIDRATAHGRGRAAVQRSVPGRTRLLWAQPLPV